MSSLGKRLHPGAQNHRPAKRQRSVGKTPDRHAQPRLDTITKEEAKYFRLLDLPNDAASNHLRARVVRRVCELLLTESKNFIHVQKVQLMSLRFTRSKSILNAKGELVRPARHFGDPSILYVNRRIHREGWRVALAVNHFQFASLGILAEFLQKVDLSHRSKLRSISMPLWREDDLTEGHMQTIATLLKDCAKLRRIEIMTRCSRIGCPVATEDQNAQEHSGDRLIYDLGVMAAMRKLPGPPKIELKVDCCIMFTHGKTGGAEKHSHHDMLIKEANDWLNQPLEGPPSIAEVLSRPAPKAKMGRPRGGRSSQAVQRNLYQAGSYVDPSHLRALDVSDDSSDSAVGLADAVIKLPKKKDDDDDEWHPDA